jgi:AraC-like DNA-binding protein
MIESLANVLAVHLIRHTTRTHRLPASADGVLQRRKLQTVIEYIMENLAGNLTLEQLGAVAQLSPYYLARQFKAATGLAPHQYVITRRVERAQHLLRAEGELRLGRGRAPRRLPGPKSLFPSLQADRRRHTGTVSALRKNAQKSVSSGKNSNAGVLLACSSSRTQMMTKSGLSYDVIFCDDRRIWHSDEDLECNATSAASLPIGRLLALSFLHSRFGFRFFDASD